MLKLDDRVVYILKILNEYGKAYLVGGAIRDILLGKIPKDIDIATNIDIQELIIILKNYNPIIISEKYNIIRIKIENLFMDIARFRKEDGILDGREPKKFEFCYDIKEDLKRRDFSVNAMAYNLNEGLIDIYGGKEDLKNGIIRIIGNDKLIRLKEDNTRVLRAFLLISKYGFSLENKTYKAIFDILKEKKLNISQERQSKFLIKLLFDKYSHETLKKMYELNLLKFFFPMFEKNFIDKDEFEKLYLAYKIYCKYNMFEEQSIGFSLIFIYLVKGKYISDNINISEKYLKKINVRINEIILIKNLMYYSKEIFKNLTKKDIKKMLLVFRNNKNISKLLNLVSFMYHYSKNYTNIVKKILDLLSKIQSIYFKDEPVFITDIDINIVDLYNLEIDNKISKEGIRQEIYENISVGILENNKEKILNYLKDKYLKEIEIKKSNCAGAVIYRYENGQLKFLLVKILEGNWGFPKGHIEVGESLLETAIREVKEETNLDIEIINPNFNEEISYILPNGEFKIVKFFIARAINYDIIIDEDEISEYKWATYHEALKLLTYSSQRDILKKSRFYIFI